ncbi:hypothetical protein T492DRAFT_838601 [Pavlovales sp. CCMP2436]|nr:hypothetical protein T492DRAFT_838601 [Pavlovales sp. CCMP2436]
MSRQEVARTELLIERRLRTRCELRKLASVVVFHIWSLLPIRAAALLNLRAHRPPSAKFQTHCADFESLGSELNRAQLRRPLPLQEGGGGVRPSVALRRAGEGEEEEGGVELELYSVAAAGAPNLKGSGGADFETGGAVQWHTIFFKRPTVRDLSVCTPVRARLRSSNVQARHGADRHEFALAFDSVGDYLTVTHVLTLPQSCFNSTPTLPTINPTDPSQSHPSSTSILLMVLLQSHPALPHFHPNIGAWIR